MAERFDGVPRPPRAARERRGLAVLSVKDPVELDATTGQLRQLPHDPVYIVHFRGGPHSQQDPGSTELSEVLATGAQRGSAFNFARRAKGGQGAVEIKDEPQRVRTAPQTLARFSGTHDRTQLRVQG